MHTKKASGRHPEDRDTEPGVLLREDLSGKTGPMISPDIFEEFMTPYYKEIIRS